MTPAQILLRRKFAASGLTQAELARRMGKDPKQIRSWLSRKRKTPDRLDMLTFLESAK